MKNEPYEGYWFDGDKIIDTNGHEIDFDGMNRAADCMNACSGLNPEGIPGLVGAAEYLLEQASDAIDKGKGSSMPAMLQLSIANLGAAMLTLAAVKEKK